MRYYLKKNATLPIEIKSLGIKVHFTVVDIVAGSRRGVYNTDVTAIQDALNADGTVKELTTDEYNALVSKKKHLSGLVAFESIQRQLPQAVSVAEELEEEVVELSPQDEEDKFAEITEVEEVTEVIAPLDPEFIRNQNDLAVLLELPIEEVRELAKTEGAPKRNGFKGHEVSLWREFLAKLNAKE